MSTLLVSFDIHWKADDPEYDKIYNALNEAIKEGRASSEWWAETTSFYVVLTPETARSFAVRIWNAAKMRKTKDRLLVIDASVETGFSAGLIQDRTLYSLLPFVTHLT